MSYPSGMKIGPNPANVSPEKAEQFSDLLTRIYQGKPVTGAEYREYTSLYREIEQSTWAQVEVVCKCGQQMCIAVEPGSEEMTRKQVSFCSACYEPDTYEWDDQC